MARNKKELLNPANGWFIVLSMLLALLLNFIPLGKFVWRPDVLAVVLVYWSIQQPRKVSFLWVFVLGLVMDVHYGAVLGQFALTYVLICAAAVAASRRIMWFDIIGQMLHVFPLLIFAHFLLVFIFWLQGGVNFSWQVLAAPVIEILLWPIVNFLLLRPQKSMAEEKL
ncbi:MAG: rod shape-determining protein MreD [Saezia sp.]